MRSTFPCSPRFIGSPPWYSANLMLDEPPFIVRMFGLVILQSERSQFRAGGFVIGVKDASNPQAFGDFNEHRGVFDIDHLPGRRLGDVQREPKDVRVGLADVDEAGGNEGIHKSV